MSALTELRALTLPTVLFALALIAGKPLEPVKEGVDSLDPEPSALGSAMKGRPVNDLALALLPVVRIPGGGETDRLAVETVTGRLVRSGTVARRRGGNLNLDEVREADEMIEARLELLLSFGGRDGGVEVDSRLVMMPSVGCGGEGAVVVTKG